jgi:hypothetical protein
MKLPIEIAGKQATVISCSASVTRHPYDGLIASRDNGW